MTGPEHYERAEQLLNGADHWDETDPDQRYYVAIAYSAAQVHATLALAAATALGGLDLPERDGNAWWHAAGTRQPKPVDEPEDGPQ